MHDTNVILTFTGALAAGLLFGYVTNSLKLSPIVGYLLAGIALGPFTPGFIADQAIAHQLAEVGVMLLMFGVGLHFQFDDLKAVRRIAVPGAIGQIAVATMLGAALAYLFGWDTRAGVVYGLCLSVASTVVLTRILLDNKQLHTPTGHVAIGWLVVEDLFTVLVLVILPIALTDRSSPHELVYALAGLGVKLIGLTIAAYLLGKRVIPIVFTRVAESSSKELFTLTVLVTALGIAVSSAYLFHVSMALGAFIAGMVVGKSEFSLRAASEVLPLRDAFAVLFFVSVGMLLNPQLLIENAALIGATLAVVVIGKSLAAFYIVLFLGYPVRVALSVSVALAQIGEFSFLLANLGRELGVIDEVAMNALVATSIFSIALNPVLFRTIPFVDRWIANRPWLSKALTHRLRKQLNESSQDSTDHESYSDHAIVVGYGPIGQKVTKLLLDNNVSTTIIELNLETTRQLKSNGTSVIYGDVFRKETLESAGIERASTLILSASGLPNPEEIVREAKSLNPSIRIIARTTYAREIDTLRNAGCETVFSGEGEVALALVEEVLRRLGATDEQVARERIRVRRDIIDRANQGI